MTLGRFRQTVAVITERKRLEAKASKRQTLSVTRTICTFIAATVPVEEGKPNPLIELAQKIGSEEEEEGEENDGGNDSSNQAKPGSYERLMELFGGKLR